MPRISAAALSDIGRVRAENQDRCICEPSLRLYGVADGVGGMPGGSQAAQTAVDAVCGSFREPETGADLARVVEKANRAVLMRGWRISPAMGIATTLTFGHLLGDRIVVAHVGDSRCYLASRGSVSRLTEDHSAENEARRRRIPALRPGEDPRALVRCLGMVPVPEPDLIERSLDPGDRYLFCTDGITQMLNEQDLAALLTAPGKPGAVLKAIVEAALARGGRDNATGVLVFVDA